MITKYFKSAVVKVPPTGHAAKLGRVFMANLPPRARADVKIDFHSLEPSAKTPESQVTFKDGTVSNADIGRIGTAEMVETFDRQSRKLQIQDTIKE